MRLKNIRNLALGLALLAVVSLISFRIGQGNKINLTDVLLFKVDHSNRDSFFSLARWFTIFLGLTLISVCIYVLYF